MSYGCAKRRDERRHSAIQRLEKSLTEATKHLNKTSEWNKKAKIDGSVAQEVAQKELKFAQTKADRLKESVENTKANLGKGTCAMRNSKRKPSKREVEVQTVGSTS